MNARNKHFKIAWFKWLIAGFWLATLTIPLWMTTPAWAAGQDSGGPPISEIPESWFAVLTAAVVALIAVALMAAHIFEDEEQEADSSHLPLSMPGRLEDSGMTNSDGIQFSQG